MPAAATAGPCRAGACVISMAKSSASCKMVPRPSISASQPGGSAVSPCNVPSRLPQMEPVESLSVLKRELALPDYATESRNATQAV